jgi:hypothetical protein
MRKRVYAIPVVAILALVLLALPSGALAQRGSARANTNAAAETTQAKTTAAKPSAIPKVVLYAAVGAELTQYDVDVNAATLAKRGSMTLSAASVAFRNPAADVIEEVLL